jgi:spermidine synthase
MNRLRFLLIALLSMTLIGLELTWTRIFSAEFFYTFAFLILSLAVLGLGLGALTLRLIPALNKEKNLGLLLTLTALFTLVGPPAVFMLKIDFSLLFNSWVMVGKLIAALALLSSAYFTGGIALALIFRQNNQDMPRLYMADLFGAAFGVLSAILLMNTLGTPHTTFLIAVPVVVAALLSSKKWLKILPLVLVAVMAFFMTRADQLLQAEREERAPVIHTHWDAVAKVKVYEAAETHQMMNIDNIAHTSAYKFDGNWDIPDSAKWEFAINLTTLLAEFDSCQFVALGAGGGGDVYQPLMNNAAKVYAVEVIPYLNKLLTDGMLAEFSGNVYNDPRVEVVTEDGRVFVRRFKNAFDIIYSSSSNTFAALASGAFALAENYLFTTEAFMDYWTALSDSGYMVLEHQAYVPRIVSEVKEALSRHGVDNPNAHYAVFDWPQARRNVLVLSKRALTDDKINHLITGEQGVAESSFDLLYPAPDSLKENLVNRIALEGWRAASDSAKKDISPCTDNRPFVAQLGLWKNLDINKLEKVIPYSDLFGFPLSKMIIVIILAIVVVLIIPLNLIPYLFKGKKLRAVPWLYFFSIGAAFMIVEVILIQKYALFVGPSVYSIATVLLTLLLASGLGSRFSKTIASKITFLAILLLLLIETFLLGYVTTALAHLSLLPRMVVAAILLFPLGFFMGMPFPKASLRVGELVDWGFAVNGAASVLGSTAIMLVAFSWGFQAALLIAALLYLMAGGLFAMRSKWS